MTTETTESPAPPLFTSGDVVRRTMQYNFKCGSWIQIDRTGGSEVCRAFIAKKHHGEPTDNVTWQMYNAARCSEDLPPIPFEAFEKVEIS